jgi:hypothetical protein
MALLFPFREICTHNKLSWDPPLHLGDRTSHFRESVVKPCLSNPRNPKTVNADLFLFLFGFFLIAISAVAMSSNLSPRLPKPDFPKLRYTHKALTFQRPTSLHRDFGLRNIANPNAMNFGTSPHETLKWSTEFDSVSIVCHLSTR